jgi:hypothetical protein
MVRIFLAKEIIYGRVSQVAKDIGGKNITWSNPLFNMAYSLFSYSGLLLWPAKLTLYHEPPVITTLALRLELIILFILAISLPFIFKKAKPVFFGIGIFILFLAPTYSPVMISWLVAERYAYFPSIAFSIIACFFYERILKNYLLTRILTNLRHKIRHNAWRTRQLLWRAWRIRQVLWRKKPNSHELLKSNIRVNSKEIRADSCWLLFFIFIIACYAVRTVARNEDWKTPERLWRQTLLVSPFSHRAHNNMGDVYGQEGNIQGAIREFKKAIELKPDYAEAHHNLGNTYYAQGNILEATKYYEQALTFNPDLFESHFNLGIIYLNSGKFDLAIEEFRHAVRIRPQDSNAQAALELAVKK